MGYAVISKISRCSKNGINMFLVHEGYNVKFDIQYTCHLSGALQMQNFINSYTRNIIQFHKILFL